MAVLTVAEFQDYCGITDATYDADFSVWEPVVEAELPAILNKDIDDLTETQMVAAKPVFAEMVLWRIAQAAPEKIKADPVLSQSAGRLSITREAMDDVTGYPRRIAVRLGRFARPRKL